MVELQVQLLQASRGADGPALVAEVTLELSEDRLACECREFNATIGIEPVDRFDQGNGPTCTRSS